MADLATRGEFGESLRAWRGRRSMSQLALAEAAGVSQRHISFLETGRAKPSREMVVHLGLVLDVPLRERNSMLVAAGFAPVYPERGLDDPDLADVRRTLDALLAAHDPFPAYVVDRCWDLMLANDAATRLIERLPESAQLLAGNLARLMLHPDGLRTAAVGWDEAAAAMLTRLQHELLDAPGDPRLLELLAEVESYPGLPDPRAVALVPTRHLLLIPLTLRLEGQAVSFFTAIASLAAPVDVTLQELRLETLLPADQNAEAVLRSLRSSPSSIASP